MRPRIRFRVESRLLPNGKRRWSIKAIYPSGAMGTLSQTYRSHADAIGWVGRLLQQYGT